MVTHYLAVVHAALFSCCITLVSGIIECECSTKECRESGRRTCIAENFCYVQYYPVGGESPDIVRGCIDHQTPLLCENRRPRKLNPDKHWPILHCCKDRDGCNKDVLPAIPENAKRESNKPAVTPPYYHKPEGSHRRANASTLRIQVVYDKEKGDEMTSSAKRTKESKYRAYINPIFVAIPTVGVLVFLVLILTVLYLLKRRNLSYHRNLSLYKSEIVAHHLGFARRPGNCQAPRSNRDRLICSHDDAVTCNHGDAAAAWSGHGDAFPPHHRTDSERSSSNGSETKLFVPT